MEGFKNQLTQGFPLIVIVEEDNAKSLGQALYNYLPKEYPFVCLDGIQVENSDYIDIGMPVIQGSILPVVVKTLVFE